MHQLGIAQVEPYPFRVQKFAIGQIAFNEDASTAVLTPFSGRVDAADRQGRRRGEARRSAVRDRQPGSGAGADRLDRRVHGPEKAQLAARARQASCEKRLKDLSRARRRRSARWSRPQRQLVAAETDLRSAGRAR